MQGPEAGHIQTLQYLVCKPMYKKMACLIQPNIIFEVLLRSHTAYQQEVKIEIKEG